MRIVINADDFGRNEKANNRINECFQKGLISSASIMANMPGFEKAIQLARDNNYLDKLGVHLVLDEGEPLTVEMKKCRKFCNEEGSYKSGIPRHQYLTKDERYIVYSEVMAQIERIKEAGINPNHLDSHRHRHQDIFIAMAINEALKKNCITYVRRHKSNDRWVKRLYGVLINMIYKLLPTTKMVDKLYSLYDTADIRNKENSFIEIMCHPEIDDDYELLLTKRVNNATTSSFD